MPLDPYAHCPAGCPKKVKFCCPDLLAELEKVGRMLEGDQRLGCLEYIHKVEEKFPGRACLLTTRAMLEDSLGQHEEAARTVARALQLHPQNPVALSQQALLVAASEGPLAAIELLQRALEASGDHLAAPVVGGIARVGQLLLRSGQVYAARGHLTLAAVLDQENPEPLYLLARLAEANVPILLRDDVDLVTCPPGSTWAKAFDSALDLAERGRWRQALVTLTALTAASGQAPAVWRNIAVLKGWLGDRAGSIEAWRKVAGLASDHDEAVEAEALALLLDDQAQLAGSELIHCEYPVTQFDPLLERLASDRRLVAERVEAADRGPDDEPPPKVIYTLLDRPLPPSAEGLTLAAVPESLARLSVYGRQTDREARVELVGVRGPEWHRAQALLTEIAADALGPAGAEESAPDEAGLASLLRGSIRFPPDITPELARDLADAKAEEHRLERWPRQSQPALGGKTPSEAAADPALRTRVEALLLILESLAAQQRQEVDYDAVRRGLGLPVSETIGPSGRDLLQLSLGRLHRLEAGELSDDDLAQAYARAVNGNALAAIRRLGSELIRRPAVLAKFDPGQVYSELAKVSGDAAQATAYLDQARAHAESQRRSTAPYDLLELALHINRMNVPEMQRMLNHLMTEHAREPGVQQRVMDMLWAAGLIRQQDVGGAAEPLPAAAAAEPAAGGIWTPDSERPAAGGGRSAIWTPGMD